MAKITLVNFEMEGKVFFIKKIPKKCVLYTWIFYFLYWKLLSNKEKYSHEPVLSYGLQNVFQKSIIEFNLFKIVYRCFLHKFQNNHVTKINKINEFSR